MRGEVFDAVRALGAAKVVAHFSGGNDEGGCDDFTFEDAEGKELVGEPWNSLISYGRGSGNEHFGLIKQAVDAELDGRYGGFAFPGCVDGNVVVDAVARTAVIEGRQEVSSWDSFEESL